MKHEYSKAGDKPLLKDVLAIDFETANNQRAACSVGLHHVIDDQVVASEEILINPEASFDAHNVRVHGIQPHQVRSSPTWPAVRDRIAELITPSTTVIAHNAAFDMGVIRANCDRYSLAYPVFPYLCTLKLSQAYFTELASCGLANMAAHMGKSFLHHNALEDAVMSAEVYRHIAVQLRSQGQDLDAYMRSTGMKPGQLLNASYTTFKGAKRAYVPPVVEQGPLESKTFFIQGELTAFTNRQARAIIEQLGGSVVATMTRSVDYFVSGKPGFYDRAELFEHREAKVRKIAAEPDCSTIVLMDSELAAFLSSPPLLQASF